MSILAPEKAEDIIACWLSTENPDDNNPAGPLYLGGNHTIADITATGGDFLTIACTTTVCGPCSGSQTIQCW
jgi:hypothetical protein